MQTIPSNQIAERGTISNLVRTLAQSPHSLEGYFQLSRALDAGKLSPKLREQIALIVAQTKRCGNSLAQHASQASQLGLSKDEIVASRWARTNNDKTNTALQFARDLAVRKAGISMTSLRESGYDGAEIIEIVGHVSLNLFENHFNDVAQTASELPKLKAQAAA